MPITYHVIPGRREAANPESIATGLGLWNPALGHAALASEASVQRGNITVRAPDTRPELGSSARGGPRPE
jgi:hypothetical protein